MLNFDLFFENHFKVFLPEIYIITITLFLLLVGVIFSNLRKYKYPFFVQEMSVLTILTLFFTLLLILNNSFYDIVIFNNLFIVDTFSNFFKVLGLLLTIGCLLISINFVKKININSFEYLILILCSTFGLMLLVSSFDLVSMYISLEVQSLSFYILASMRKDSAFSTEAGLKYFILGTFSSGILLLGISFIYGSVGSTSFESLGKFFIGFDFLNTSMDTFNITNQIIVGIICIFIGILFKLTAVPFHMWAPDVYEGSPLFVTVIFSLIPKVGVLAIAAKIFYFALYEGLIYWQAIGLLASILSVSVGTLKALQQNKIKRFLAYSSIGHVGFLLLGFSTGTIIGIQSLVFYFIIYSVMMLNLWSVVIALEIKNKKYVQIKYINDLQGLAKSNPLLAYTLALVMFSMAGVPPLAGFLAKFYIFFVGFESSFNILVIISILFSVVSAFYYIRFIKIMFFDESNTGFLVNSDISYIHSLVLGSTFLFILFLFLHPSFLLLATQYIGLVLFVV
jgi:proton-translocating NADH-quinone oxidoreductase chain N